MNDRFVQRLFEDARRGRLSRRQALATGLRLGLASPVIAGLMAAAPVGVNAAPARSRAPRLQPTGGSFTVVRDGSSPDIDPHSAYDNLASMLFYQGLYEMLVQYKGSATDDYDPMLAESWEVAPDNTSATFKIAASATFHDGSPCGAQEVKDSFTRFLLLDMGPVNVIKRFITSPDQMEVVDPTTITFTFDRPQPLFLAAMASEYGPLVVNPRLVEEHKTEEDPWAHEWFLANASGTGPYFLEENNAVERVVLKRYADYHGGWEGNHFDQIVVRIVPEVSTRRQLLETGDADATAMNLTPVAVEALSTNPDLNVEIYDSTAVFWVIMNAVRLSTEARQGFSYAFPYAEVVDSAYKGLIVRSGPLGSTVRGYDPDVFIYPTDPAKAKELILAAGFSEGDTFDYMFDSGDEVESTIAQLFQAKVQEIGFNLELVEVERAALIDLRYGDSPAEERPMFIGGAGWWPDYNDPWNQFAPNFTDKTKDGSANSGYYLNERFEAIMTEAEQYTDDAQLDALMKEAQNILTELDPPAIYYGQLKWYTVLRNDIQGFVPNSLYLSSFPLYRMHRG